MTKHQPFSATFKLEKETKNDVSPQAVASEAIASARRTWT